MIGTIPSAASEGIEDCVVQEIGNPEEALFYLVQCAEDEANRLFQECNQNDGFQEDDCEVIEECTEPTPSGAVVCGFGFSWDSDGPFAFNCVYLYGRFIDGHQAGPRMCGWAFIHWNDQSDSACGERERNNTVCTEPFGVAGGGSNGGGGTATWDQNIGGPTECNWAFTADNSWAECEGELYHAGGPHYHTDAERCDHYIHLVAASPLYGTVPARAQGCQLA